MSFVQQNRAAWNQLAETGSVFAKVATDEECAEPLKILDGRNWLPPSVHGLEVLCLAAAGGWQSILYASAGANVTVFDVSPSMLALDRREAERRGLKVRTVEGSMDDLSQLADSSFDIVHQPVSTCYVANLAKVYGEIARVSRHGAIYISQHKQPTSLQIIGRTDRNQYIIGTSYYHQGPLPPATDTSYREPGTMEFMHRWEQLIGDLCSAGYVIEDLREPYRGDPTALPGDYHHRGWFIAPYLRMKARRVRSGMATESAAPRLWTP